MSDIRHVVTRLLLDITHSSVHDFDFLSNAIWAEVLRGLRSFSTKINTDPLYLLYRRLSRSKRISLVSFFLASLIISLRSCLPQDRVPES